MLITSFHMIENVVSSTEKWIGSMLNDIYLQLSGSNTISILSQEESHPLASYGQLSLMTAQRMSLLKSRFECPPVTSEQSSQSRSSKVALSTEEDYNISKWSKNQQLSICVIGTFPEDKHRNIWQPLLTMMSQSLLEKNSYELFIRDWINDDMSVICDGTIHHQKYWPIFLYPLTSL